MHVIQLSCQAAEIRRVRDARFIPTVKLKRVFGLRAGGQDGLRGFRGKDLDLLGLVRGAGHRPRLFLWGLDRFRARPGCRGRRGAATGAAARVFAAAVAALAQQPAEPAEQALPAAAVVAAAVRAGGAASRATAVAAVAALAE